MKHSAILSREHMTILERTIGHTAQNVAALTGMVSALQLQVAVLTQDNARMAQELDDIERRLAIMEARQL